MQLQVCVLRSLLMKRVQWRTTLDCMTLLFLVYGPRGGDSGGSDLLLKRRARFASEGDPHKSECNHR